MDGRGRDQLFEEKEFFGLGCLGFALSRLSTPLSLVRRGGGVGTSVPLSFFALQSWLVQNQKEFCERNGSHCGTTQSHSVHEVFVTMEARGGLLRCTDHGLATFFLWAPASAL